MAEKKSTSRAEKAVSTAKKKTGAATADTKHIGGKKKKPVELPNDDNRIPGRVVLAVASLGLFILFLVMGVRPEGAVLNMLRRVLLALIGKAAFYFAIPALLYMFIITVSSNGQPIRMRCICLSAFVLLSSCVYHLAVNNQTFVGGFQIISDLWKGGIAGTSGGLLCGLVAMLLRWACGTVLSYIVFIGAAILAVLAAMKITVPSIIRAIQNRPRDDWEDEFPAERPEPAAMVVNHIANKRIEQKRARRQQLMMEPEEDILDEEEFVQLPIAIPPKTPRKADIAVAKAEKGKQKQLFDVEQGAAKPEPQPKTEEIPARESM